MTTSSAEQVAGITGRVALVTGAARGIGAAICARLTTAGARVGALDVHYNELPDLPDVAAFPCDVRDPEAVETAVTSIEHELGPVAIAVNVAGVLRQGPLAQLSEHDLRELFEVNTFGVIRICRAVAEPMVRRRQGSIVNIASNAGHVPRIGLTAYGASKAAVIAFTRHLALELAHAGIRCNSVSPGSTDTAMLSALTDADRAIAGDAARFRLGVPLGRVAQPADIAEAVLWLASEQARHITMQDLVIDGGASLTG
ncbi:SDR family oxidoreductase [Nonomuraea cavernae]|uniref:2,3-dihydro-2,3-dihydroxybenzoate dehydrogenase n=1 Tax=Nonomuraea cavernae TaxID=2045107 RepID=A0A917ZEJ3_9ACTN|nr:SDR family oxidoreductase [Nonomuraea cavernae]MCA2190608.1 SDR family oxidoreductase [Nonomuraea cavernae]GGO81368.1 2,3-dihydro-2,3-dihydroxybenzoate dehydrogenase [Nonomuraea cavernae]